MDRLRRTNCKRCNKEIYTLIKPIHGSQSAYNQYGEICSNCMSKEEEFKMLLSVNYHTPKGNGFTTPL